MKNFDENLINEIKKHTQDLANYYLDRSADGNFVCPICGNGSGTSGTGITFKDNGSAFCHHDGGGWFDIITAVKAKLHCDFVPAVTACADFLGLDHKSGDCMPQKKLIPTHHPITKPQKDDKPQQDLTDYYCKCHANINDTAVQSYLKKRHLDDNDLIDNFNLGFDKNCNCLVIPHTKTFCTRRYLNNWTDKTGKEHRYKYVKGQRINLFNLDALQNNDVVFVAEGAINALSIIKVGGNAIALGGTGNDNLLLQHLQKINNRPAIILLLDEDKAGQETADKLLLKINNLKFLAVKAHLPIYPAINQDINDVLRSDETAFKNFVINTVTKVKELKTKMSEWDEEKYKPPVDIPTSNFYIQLPGLEKFGLADKFICPEGYHININGTYKIGKAEDKKISNQPIIMTKRIENIDDNIHKREIAYFDRKKNKWYFVVADNEVIASNRSILKLAKNGLNVISTTASLMVNYLNDFESANQEVMTDVESISQLGWRNGDFIYPNSDDKYAIDIDDGGESIEIFGIKGDKKKYLTYLDEAINATKYSNFAIGAALAAPLVEPLNLRSMTVHLGGKSGGGKSATLKLACSIFGNPKYGVGSFNSTFVAIERRIVAMKNFPVFLDELQLAKNDKAWQYHLPKFPFFVSDSASKGRGTVQGREKTKHFYTVVLTSGEDFMTDFSAEMGAKQRVVELNAKEYLPENFAKKINEEIANENFGLIGRDWINFIKNHINSIKTEYKNLRRKLSDKYPDNSVDHINLVALSTVTSTLFALEFLHADALDTVRKNFGNACSILEDLPKINELSDIDRAKQIIEEAEEVYAKNFTDKHGTFPASSNNDFWGIKDEGFSAWVPSILRKVLTDNGFSARKIIKELVTDGYIQKDNQGNSTTNINNKGRKYFIPRCNSVVAEAA